MTEEAELSDKGFIAVIIKKQLQLTDMSFFKKKTSAKK